MISRSVFHIFSFSEYTFKETVARFFLHFKDLFRRILSNTGKLLMCECVSGLAWEYFKEKDGNKGKIHQESDFNLYTLSFIEHTAKRVFKLFVNVS